MTACSDRNSSGALFENYHYRMSNITGSDIAPDASIDPPAYPSRRQLAAPIPAVKIDLLEYLRLSPCDLQRLIGKRNSGLGKVMETSQRLIYEIEFIRLSDQCLELLRETDADSQLQQKLQQAVDAKRQHLPGVAWNATFAGAEFNRFFSVAAVSVDVEAVRVRPNLLLESLGRLHNRLAPLAQATGVEGIEQELAVIGSEKYGGRLLRSLAQAESYLRAVNLAIDARLAQGPLCFNQRANRRAEIWQNVFYKYYIGQVQPYLAALHQRTRGLVQVVEPLLQVFAPPPAAFADYWRASFSLDDDASVLRRFERALDRHTRLWQDVLNQCGMMPGSESTTHKPV
nr:DUF3080 family protein [Exilibacterium tricleocarpae]